MPIYVIHIGPPKAGSKNLQSSLHSVRSHLAAQGIYYPSEWGNIHHAGLLADLETIPNPRLETIFQSLNRSQYKTIVLSCEGFYRLGLEQLQYLQKLLDGAPVRIVYYWRRWSEWIPSQWQETVKAGRFETFPQEHFRFTQDPMKSRESNPTLTWSKFEDLFGRDSLALISFDNLIDRNLDPYKHFVQAVLQCTVTAAPENVMLNSSMSKFDIEVLRAINYLHYRTEGRIDESTRNLYLRTCETIDREPIISRMESDVATMALNDHAPVFAPVMDAMMPYRDRFLNLTRQGDLFIRRVRRFDYVQQNYLLDDEAVQALKTIYALVRGSVRHEPLPLPR